MAKQESWLTAVNRHYWWCLVGLVILAVGGPIAIAALGWKETALQQALVSGAAVVLAIFGSFVFLRRDEDRRVRQAARTSVRNVLVHYSALSTLGAQLARLQAWLAEEKNGNGSVKSTAVELQIAQLIDFVNEQFRSVDADIENWRDLSPKEVDEEVHRFQNGRKNDRAD